jgi:hypothetical protein
VLYTASLHSSLSLYVWVHLSTFFKPSVDTSAPIIQPAPFQSASFSHFLFLNISLSPVSRLLVQNFHAHPELRIKHTILNNLHAGSLGCAPTPSQYFALAESSLTSFHFFPSPSIGALGIGSYVPVFYEPVSSTFKSNSPSSGLRSVLLIG